MSGERRDYLRVCNEQGVALEDFKLQFCDRCLQPECTRSQAGESKFEARVSNWQERLFTDVPRLDPNDPRVGPIRAKKFLEIDAGPVPEIRASPASAWVDPRDLDSGPQDLDASPKNPQASEEPIPSAPSAPSTIQEPPPKTLAEEPSTPPPAPAQPQQQARANLMNTPFQQGQMLGGRPRPAVPEANDPWAAPVPQRATETGGVKVVEPGAKIKLGGPGV